MNKTLSVQLLKVGDQFQFLTDRPSASDDAKFGSQSGTMVIIRNPMVNLAAGSCFFRYRLADQPAGEQYSWNGNSDAKVRVADAPPPADARLKIFPAPATPSGNEASLPDAAPASSDEPTMKKKSPAKQPGALRITKQTEAKPADDADNIQPEKKAQRPNKRTLQALKPAKQPGKKLPSAGNRKPTRAAVKKTIAKKK